jgi:hypothetical protein
MKMADFWFVAPCSLVMMEAASTSETLVNFYRTTRRYKPEDSHLQTIPSSYSKGCHTFWLHFISFSVPSRDKNENI